MKFYRLDYQYHKDIVDENILTVFVVAQNKGEVEQLAKKLRYAVENITKLTEKEFKKEKETNEHFRLEYAENYL
ncbi:hypothetical protein [Staphylococcus sp. HMSC069E09]|uniref:hypothetical protein n=1 Tax=Staphylococcus sp. HMSC069E09 TaxID=1715063 RepID=UPI0008A99180|nr:hypothetical protein [Staphylococcus sp. HMSC069E09]OHQ40454.1 hypothetical protein HMPREF2584_07945 [Staphylococcus sp. HMSC069E09]